MAFSCVLGYKPECDGCGACSEERVAAQCDQCGEDIFEGEDVYEWDGLILHEDCLCDYMRAYRKVMEIPEL